MTHKVRITFSGDVAAGYFAHGLAANGAEARPGLQPASSGMEDHPAPYVDVPHIPGTHYPSAAAVSEHFGAYVHDEAERRRLWTPDLIKNAERVIRGDLAQETGAPGSSAPVASPAERRSAA